MYVLLNIYRCHMLPVIPLIVQYTLNHVHNCQLRKKGKVGVTFTYSFYKYPVWPVNHILPGIQTHFLSTVTI